MMIISVCYIIQRIKDRHLGEVEDKELEYLKEEVGDKRERERERERENISKMSSSPMPAITLKEIQVIGSRVDR